MQKIVSKWMAISFISYLILWAISFSSCRTIKTSSDTLVKDSVVYKDRIVTIPVPPIYIPGDTVKLHDTVPCPDVNWKGAAVSHTHKTSVKAEIKNGQLSIECIADSLLIENDSLRLALQDREHYRTTSEKTTVQVPVKYIPWWFWLMIAGNGILLFFNIRKMLR